MKKTTTKISIFLAMVLTMTILLSMGLTVNAGTVYYPDYDEDQVVLDGGDHIVMCRTLNVRTTPDTKYSRIGTVHRGDIVRVCGWYGDWAMIQWEQFGYAYVHGDYIEQVTAAHY